MKGLEYMMGSIRFMKVLPIFEAHSDNLLHKGIRLLASWYAIYCCPQSKAEFGRGIWVSTYPRTALLTTYFILRVAHLFFKILA